MRLRMTVLKYLTRWLVECKFLRVSENQGETRRKPFAHQNKIFHPVIIAPRFVHSGPKLQTCNIVKLSSSILCCAVPPPPKCVVE